MVFIGTYHLMCSLVHLYPIEFYPVHFSFMVGEEMHDSGIIN